MKRALSCVVALVASCSYPRERTLPPPQNPFPKEVMRGICYSHDWENPSSSGYGTPTSLATLSRLKELGVSWISLTHFGVMEDKNSNEVHFRFVTTHPTKESDERISVTVRAAHQLGLKVLLKPHLMVNDGSWSGAITPTDWEAWSRSYQEFVEHYAALAERLDIDGFLLGNELGSATRTVPDAFLGFLRSARARYSGPISYGANWNEAAKVPFWGELDAISISAYWPLTHKPNATEEELFLGAQAIERELFALAQKYSRPVILTEIGYRSVVDSARDPASWPELDRNRPVDGETQARAYRAVFRALWGKPYLKGIFFWRVISDGTWNFEGPGGFSPLDKPAEQVLRHYFAP